MVDATQDGARDHSTRRLRAVGTGLFNLIVINESHLRSVLAEFADYYNRDRPHRTISSCAERPHRTGSTFAVLIVRSLLAGMRSRRDLMLENLALRHQLQVALRTNPHPRLRPRDRVIGCGCGVSGRLAGDGICASSDRRRCCVGIGRVGACIGPRSPAPDSGGPA